MHVNPDLDASFNQLISDAIAEAKHAQMRFPQPNYVISKIAEEAGEVVKAAIHCAERRETADGVAGEMRQLIAMLYRLWVEGDEVHGLWAIGKALDDITDHGCRPYEGPRFPWHVQESKK